MLTVTGDTIYYDGTPVAWLTIPNGTLRQRVLEALADLPDVTPLREALTTAQQAEGLTQMAITAEALVTVLDGWLQDNTAATGERLL